MNNIGTYITYGVVVFGLVCVVGYQHARIQEEEAEKEAYQNNTHTLLGQIERLQIDSTTSAVKVNTLQLVVDEYKQYRAEDAELIKQLGVKLKNVKSTAKSTVEVEAPINTVVIRDTVFQEVSSHEIQSIQYSDDYIKFDGKIEFDSLTAKINVPITLTQVLYKIPKHKFLWWSWGCKQVKQVISCDNPYVNIKYSEFIELKK